MPFAFSDLLGFAWIFAFPAFLHILNYVSGRNRGITAPRSPVQTQQYIKNPVKFVKSNRSDYIKPQIKIKPEIKVKPAPLVNHAPVKYTPDTWKPAVTITQNWAPICSRLPIKTKPAQIQITKVPIIIKPAKFKKARNYNRVAKFLKLTINDELDLKRLLGIDIYKHIPYMSICWLKTFAIKSGIGIDDWISLIDSRASYKNNLETLQKNYGAGYSEDELTERIKKYQDMAQDFYKNM